MKYNLLILILIGTMTACGGGGSATTTQTAPPSTPPPAPSLQSITVTPSDPSIIAGGTEQYSATANYSDGSTQNVSGSATWSSSSATVATVSSTGLATTLTEGTTTITATLKSIAGSTSLTATPLTVQVSVVASDSAARLLSYMWRSTDGSIQNVNAASTTWTLPDGPGVHFAYVLVSNGFGGYTEQRIAVNTDTIGTPLQVPTPKPFTVQVPADGPPFNDIYRGFMTGGQLSSLNAFPGVGPNWSPSIPVSVPDMPTFIASGTFTGISNGTVSAKTNVRGEFVLPGAQALPTFFSTGFFDWCDPSGLVAPVNIAIPFQGCGSMVGLIAGIDPSFSLSTYNTDFDPLNVPAQTQIPDIAGEVLLQDGSTCGIVDEFFGVEVVPSATLLDGSGNILAGPVRANQWGDYDLPYLTGAASVLLQCENNSPVMVSIPTPAPSGTTPLAAAVVPASAPIVTSMTAILNGTQISQLSPTTSVPSDIVPLGDAFLAEKGLDSRIGACQYYKAVGAVQGCDAAGNFSGAITFEDWKSQVNIDQYALNPPNPGGGPVYQATYINRVDLNLARVHHSVVNGAPPNPSSLNTAPYTYVANYVCNHLGPTVLNPPQTGPNSIDSVIQNVVNGQNLVACVAMDYSTFPVLTSSQYYGPLIRFLIFGPNGQLLPSVNLDGRREKFVPGTCVVCHGGDHYAGKYPEDGSGNANVGGHFLPYDSGNFEFSDQAGLTGLDQAQAIYNLNQNILAFNTPTMPYNPGTFALPSSIASASVTPAEIKLIQQWYLAGPLLFNESYVDSSWGGQTFNGVSASSVYLNVYARSCRTCHVAMSAASPSLNFENFGAFLISGSVVDPANCGGAGGAGRGLDRNRMYKMPNSLTTFNAFWGSHNSTTEFDQVKLFHQFFNCTDNPSANIARAPGKAAHK